jgi:hypothetical protein
MKYHIVIARYNENIDWIKYINTNLFDIFIYNKGNDINNNNLNYKIIKLDNVGRESHTYLYHIINNFDNLPEKIIFTQAHPFDHVRNTFINEINNFNNCYFNFLYFSKNMLNIKYDINENKFIEYGTLNGNEWKNYHNLDSPIATTMKNLFENYEHQKVNIIFGPGAIYGINKELIVKNKKDFYIKCIDVLNNSSNLKNPDEGHSFERLWYYIFNI